MRHTEYHFWTIDKSQEEEAWLKEKCAKGEGLVRAGAVRYVFEDCQPNEYQYKIMFMDTMPGTPENNGFLEFAKENGIEKIGQFHRWAYLRKKNDGTPFELFSDVDSELRQAEKIRNLAAVIFIVEAICFFIEFTGFLSRGTRMLGPVLIIGGLLVFISKMYFSLNRKVKALQSEKSLRE